MDFEIVHSWDLSYKEAIALQDKLKSKVRIEKLNFFPKLIAGADVYFRVNKAIGSIVVTTYPNCEIVEEVVKIDKISYPYIPGLLAFREGPVLEKCLRSLKKEPEIIIFDGQGLIHPRRVGLATHMGILLGKPTIGVAKSLLLGEYKEPAQTRGSFSYILDKDKNKIGAVVRTKDNVKPVYVSVGNRIDLNNAIEIILKCTVRYRLPEPLRLADQLSRKYLFYTKI
ncbi:MAG: deoxyribonuclease V [Candidatus Omnitrophica bacterium]|nr:deoxyribonuclease V [Candidatus Omnitrophota bacterium]MCM8826731.1 deoxyribonuclease V [Candidatus Omnitrophota bacterium]